MWAKAVTESPLEAQIGELARGANQMGPPRPSPPAAIRVICLTLFIGGGIGPCPALATDHFNLESGIPITIEDIIPTEHGSIEFQAFGRYLRQREEKNAGQTEPRLVWGILEKTQLEIASPLLLGEGTANGNGDVQMSILRMLWDNPEREWWPGVAFEAEVRLPTGVDRSDYTNRVDAGLTVLMMKSVGEHTFHLNAGFDLTGDKSEEERIRRFNWSIAVGHHISLTEWLVIVSDVVWRQADDEGSEDVWLFETGFRAQINRTLIGAIGIGAGLNRGPDTSVFSLTAGLQFSL